MTFRGSGWLIVIVVILGAIITGAVYSLTQGMETASDGDIQPTSERVTRDESVTKRNLASPLVVTDFGVMITGVMPNGPAAQAGLQAGDVIIALEGQQIDFDHDLAEIISTYKPGDRVTLELEQPGAGARRVTVELGQPPGPEGGAYLGVVYQPSAQAKRSEEVLNEATEAINLVSREITLKELARLASFDILWPQDLSDKYQLLRIMEMSENATATSNSGIFYLEYINLNDQNQPLSEQSRLFIWQNLKTSRSLPNLADKQAVGVLRLADGTEIPIYESEGGRSNRAFLERGQVNVELSFWGLPVADVERIASSLAVN